jgi:hypothetical protein
LWSKLLEFKPGSEITAVRPGVETWPAEVRMQQGHQLHGLKGKLYGSEKQQMNMVRNWK